MRRRTTRRALATLAALAALGTLPACRPNIPLIPGIKSDVRPLATMAELTPRDRCPQASRAHPHTAP